MPTLPKQSSSIRPSSQNSIPAPSRSTLASSPTPSRDRNAALEIASRLLGEVAHDLRSPLFAVRESASLLSDGYLGPTTDQQLSCLQGIIEQCQEMDQLVGDMLAIEQVQSGMPKMHRRWLNLAEIQAQVQRTVSHVIAQRQLTLTWDRPDGIPSVFADPGKIGRLLLNLVGNAVRVLPAGGQILIRNKFLSDQGVLQLQVIDQGPGIAPENLERFAERGESGTAGTGLGLVISRQLAALHFSPLEITSRVGKGTCVGFQIPAAGPASVADAWLRYRARFIPAASTPTGLRIDPPESPRPWQRKSPSPLSQTAQAENHVALQHDGPPPRNPGQAAAVCVRLGGAVASEVAERLDLLLQADMQNFELGYRAAQREWILLLDATSSQAKTRLANLQNRIQQELPSARIRLSNGLQLKLSGRTARASLRDLFVRSSLNVSTELSTEVSRDSLSEIPAGEDCTIPQQRLEAELRRLAIRSSRHKENLIDQAKALRLVQ